MKTIEFNRAPAEDQRLADLVEEITVACRRAKPVTSISISSNIRSMRTGSGVGSEP